MATPTVMFIRRTRVMLAAAVLLACAASQPRAASTHGLLDDTDRRAFRAWFTLLADAQFERQTADVVDCASLVRHAYREALRTHSPEWYRTNHLPVVAAIPDVRERPPVQGTSWPLFRVASRPDRYAEFADAATIIRMNARLVARDVTAAQPGDLIFFRQESGESTEPRGPGLATAAVNHLMVFVGASRFDPGPHDWVVYHTGPVDGAPGEVRKATVADLLRHPAARWRPQRSNPAFMGVYRLQIVDGER
jgi:uncharacterized protein YfaT (DUF1175 family)